MPNIKKTVKNLILTLSVFMLTAVPAFADATTPAANTAVTGAMNDLSADLGATLGAVAPYAISIFAVILAWKYGKKLFNMVAK